MSTNVRNDTPTPAAGQRPANIAEAIGLLSTRDPYEGGHPEMFHRFVADLINQYPLLVMERVLVRLGVEALREYRGEV